MNMVSIYIIRSDHEPLRLQANDIVGVLPTGKDTEIDERLMTLLRDTPGIEWRYTGVALPDDERHEGVGDDFDAASIIDGNVADVSARLSSLTSEQLLSVRAAEEGRDGATRKGVIAAINEAIEAINEGNPND